MNMTLSVRARAVCGQLRWIVFAGAVVLSLVVTPILQAQEMNGFNLSGAAIPRDRIHHGGPAKDGIPAIDRPIFVTAKQGGTFLKDDDGVLGVAHRGVVRAYPIRILNWHEIVNDRFADQPVLITFCPLCGTGMVFESRADDRTLDFGVSGLLYNSDVLMYDRQTQSLWSQIMMRAVSGPMNGKRLTPIAVTHTTWADWRKSHPATQVLSAETGHVRSYDRNPYAGYETSESVLFPVEFRAAGYHPKERVLGIVLGGQYKAYPFVELGKGPGMVSDRVGGVAVTVRFDRGAPRATAHAADGAQLPAVVGFWFAWYAFHPQTGIYRFNEPNPGATKR